MEESESSSSVCSHGGHSSENEGKYESLSPSSPLQIT